MPLNPEQKFHSADLMSFGDSDLTSSVIREVEELLNVSRKEAKRLVDQYVDAYRRKDEASYPNLPRERYRLLHAITNPLRQPHMVERLSPHLSILQKDTHLKSVLDYGAGFGRDTVVYAELGYNVTHADFIGEQTPFIKKRFKLRKLKIGVQDVRDLGEERYDVIHCVDVIEHVYDMEYVVADIVARLNTGGHFVCFPAFMNTWNGDHIEKNCGYPPYFLEMMESIGLKLVYPHFKKKSLLRRLLVKAGILGSVMDVFHFVKEGQCETSIETERRNLRKKLYQRSAKHSAQVVLLSALSLPLATTLSWLTPIKRYRTRFGNMKERVWNYLIDNGAIRRLSLHQLNLLNR